MLWHITKFEKAIRALHQELKGAKRVLLTAPGEADGDSVGTQLALRKILEHSYPHLDVAIINDLSLPCRYQFLPEVEWVDTPETYSARGLDYNFDIGIIVDGGVDRAGRLRKVFDSCPVTVFIDHHVVSCDYDYSIRIVEPLAVSTTELVYEISQTAGFMTPVDRDFSEYIYLGLIFDTGFFRHACTTPESMELAAKLLRTGFDFTEVGERGMLQRSFDALQLMSYALSKARLEAEGKIIWSVLTQKELNEFRAKGDDREGIVDHLFLTLGIEVACLFFELPDGNIKVSFRSQGAVDVAHFARGITEHGGGHCQAAGANLSMPLQDALDLVMPRLKAALPKAPRLRTRPDSLDNLVSRA